MSQLHLLARVYAPDYCVFKPKRMQNKKIVTDKHTEDKVYKGDLEHVTLQGGIVSKPRCV